MKSILVLFLIFLLFSWNWFFTFSFFFYKYYSSVVDNRNLPSVLDSLSITPPMCKSPLTRSVFSTCKSVIRIRKFHVLSPTCIIFHLKFSWTFLKLFFLLVSFNTWELFLFLCFIFFFNNFRWFSSYSKNHYTVENVVIIFPLKHLILCHNNPVSVYFYFFNSTIFTTILIFHNNNKKLKIISTMSVQKKQINFPGWRLLNQWVLLFCWVSLVYNSVTLIAPKFILFIVPKCKSNYLYCYMRNR